MKDTRKHATIDAGYFGNPKIAPLVGRWPRAVLLHMEAILYSAEHDTGGEFVIGLAVRTVSASWCGMRCTDHPEGMCERGCTAHCTAAMDACDVHALAARGLIEWTPDPETARVVGPGTGHLTGDALFQIDPPAPTRKRKPRRRATAIPDGYAPPRAEVEKAVEKYPALRSLTPGERAWWFEVENGKFVDYWVSKGRTNVDWDATWRNWIRNAVTQYNPPRPAEQAPADPYAHMRRL